MTSVRAGSGSRGIESAKVRLVRARSSSTVAMGLARAVSDGLGAVPPPVLHPEPTTDHLPASIARTARR